MGEPAPHRLIRGRAMRIPTGGAMPDGADAVVMVEDTAVSGDDVEVVDAGHASGNITAAGADVRSGDLLFDRGVVLTPAKVGLLAGAGIASVEAYVPPRVGVLLTGDELVAPSEPIRAGQIRDSNRYAIGAALTAMGFDPQQYDRVADQRADLVAAFARALEECDAVVVSGGSSAGDRDYTPDVIADAGKPGVIVHHLRAKPGRPTVLGIVGDKPVIGLPGNPVSALVMLETVGKPVLLRMLDRASAPASRRAVLASARTVSPNLEHRIPVRLHGEGGELRAEPLIGTSAQMHVLGFADGLVAVPLGAGRLEAGASVDVLPFSAAPS